MRSQAVSAGLAEVRDVNGDGYVDIVPTELGVQQARALDKGLWDSQLRGKVFSFSDPTRDWFFATKVKFGDFTVGLQVWKNVEGTTPWYSDLARGEGGQWAPRQTTIFAKYAKPVTASLALNVLMRYKNDQLDDESRIPMMATYASGYLGVLDLLKGTPTRLTSFKLDQVSTQFRTEFTAVYQRSERLRAIVGADIRDSSAQGPYFVESDPPVSSFGSNPTPEDLKATDVGIFAQGSYSWGRRLKGVIGLRYDGNEVRENERVSVRIQGASEATLVSVRDFGKFFSPRAAVVATLGRRADGTRRFILKSIYSRASQQPSNFQRFASDPHVRELASPSLGREAATNTEASVTWDMGRALFEVSAHSVRYSDALQTALRVDPCCQPARTGQFQGVGGFCASGLQSSLSSRWNGYDAYANYTFTRAVNSGQPRDEFGDNLSPEVGSSRSVPIADIARHKFNVGMTRRWQRFDASVRMNVVGERPTSLATSSRLNASAVPSYAVLHATLGYRDDPRGLTLQVAMNNVLNTQYWDPGVRTAGSLGFVGRIPQPGFHAFAQVVLDLNLAKRPE